MLKRFLQDEQGQDLIEYTLLVAFVCPATAALFVNSGGSLSGIWISANSRLGAANTSAAIRNDELARTVYVLLWPLPSWPSRF